MAPRLVRRRPLLERIKTYLNPLDFMLWLSEELDSNDWDQRQKEWATPIGILLNVIFLIARANTGGSTRRTGDDVFGDDLPYIGWFAWFVRHVEPCHCSLADSKHLGILPRALSFSPILHECSLHFLPPTALQAFRKLHR